jgi:hypothetical protein
VPAPKKVEVDVFRRGQRVRTQPLPGSDSWTHEAVQTWRELCSASDWLDAAAAVHALAGTLPQLLHHREQVGGGSRLPEAFRGMVPVWCSGLRAGLACSNARAPQLQQVYDAQGGGGDAAGCADP